MVDRRPEDKELREMGIPDPETREEHFYGLLGASVTQESAFAKVVRVGGL